MPEFILWDGRGIAGWAGDGMFAAVSSLTCAVATATVYDPADGSITGGVTIPTASTGTLLWTGPEVLQWTGTCGTGLGGFGTGIRGDLTFNASVLLPETDAPTAGTLHTAVWTGYGMIVWGGAHYESDLLVSTDTGAIYSPPP